MNKRLKIAIPVIAGVLVLAAGAGVAAAKTAGQDTAYGPAASYQVAGAGTDEGGYYCGGNGGMMGYGAGVTPQVAGLLGTTVADLEAQLRSGKTLADIAGEKGISKDQLVETMMVPFKAHLDLMVKDGYMDQDWVDAHLQQARENLERTVTGKLGNNGRGWGRMSDMMNGIGGMMSGWGGWNGSGQQPDAGSAPRGGFGGMMGGYNGGPGGYGGGMMGRW